MVFLNVKADGRWAAEDRDRGQGQSGPGATTKEELKLVEQPINSQLGGDIFICVFRYDSRQMGAYKAAHLL